MLLVSKGGTISLPDEQIPVVIVSIGFSLAALVAIFLVPWLYRTVILDDLELKWYDMWKGPFLFYRGPVPPKSQGSSTTSVKQPRRLSLNLHSRKSSADAESGMLVDMETVDITEEKPHKSLIGPRPDGPWHSKESLWWAVKFAVLHGVDQDVVSSQSEGDSLSGNIKDMHARSVKYDGKAEHLFKYLQILISATASFAHGANDVSK